MDARVLTDWHDSYAKAFGSRTLHLKHRLAESGLFTDEALVRLLERLPRDAYQITTMDPVGHDASKWRHGDFGGRSGHEILEAVRTGLFWINIGGAGTVEPAYQKLIDETFQEFEHRVPGLRTFKRKGAILISSPGAQVYYHCDIPGQSLWQIRGEKRVYVYPNEEPFLRRDYMERIIVERTDESLMPYEAWFDDHAEIYDLKAGEMLTWALNGPHRIVNADCVNVSLATEHWTSEIRRVYAANYANRLLRRAGVRDPARPVSGPGFWARAAIAAGHKYALNRHAQYLSTVEFEVDTAAPGSMREVKAYQVAN